MTEAPIVYERTVAVSCGDEWCNPTDAARITLTEKAVERVITLAELAVAHGVSSIHEFNYDAEWGFFDDDEETFIPTEDAGDRNEDGPFRAECNEVVVHGLGEHSYATWTAYWKHTDVKVSTDAVEIGELREALQRIRGPLPAPLSGDEGGLSCTSH